MRGFLFGPRAGKEERYAAERHHSDGIGEKPNVTGMDRRNLAHLAEDLLADRSRR